MTTHLDLYSSLPWLIPAPPDFNAQCRAIEHDGQEAGWRIKALASYALDENQLFRLSKTIAALQRAGASLAPLVPYRLGVASNGTTNLLVPALVATAARYGIALECVATGFNQVVQEVLSPESEFHRFAPQAVVVALDWRGVPLQCEPGSSDARGDAVQSALDYFQVIRDGIRRHSDAVSIVQNLVAPPEDMFGSFERVLPGARRNLIDGINQGLADRLYGSADVLLDAAGLAEKVGVVNWHDPNQWNLAKLPFSQTYVPLYADHVCRIISALLGKSRRCAVLDLDNTLWGGVIGDDGLAGIQIGQGDPVGEAYAGFQRFLLSLRERGVVLAVSSKNEDETARLPFRKHPEMLLREDHFAVFQANWNDKASNIQAIAEELSLGLESFVFVDDNPYERDLVRKALPQVAVPEMPADPAYYTRILSAAGYFESVAFSREDAQRAEFYAGNARRAALQKQVGDFEEHLRSLRMEISFQPFDATGRSRIAQLINKSNQFNLTTRRYTEAEVAGLESRPDVLTLQVRLADIFGDNGMISVVICRAIEEETWEIDEWLMSCRVLGRRVENMVLREILDHAARANIRRLVGMYQPTERNKLVQEHYQKLGFTLLESRPDGSTVWELEVAKAVVQPAPMKVNSSGFQVPALETAKAAE
jgi:FkbH-like protein